MPKAKSKVKTHKQSLRSNDLKSKVEPTSPTFPTNLTLNRLKNFRPDRTTYIAAIVVGLALLAYLNKGWFIAATVNGKPISNLELQRRLNTSYRESTLNQMIGERILEQEGAKKGVVITQADVQKRVEVDEASYGGKEIFEMLLAQQGLSREDYQTRVKSLLLIERVYAEEIKPTEEEIKSFMEENKELPEATDEARFTEFAQSQLSQQKLSQVFSQRFSELRQSAKVKIF